VNGFDLERKPPATTPSAPARRPDAPRTTTQSEKPQAGPDADARKRGPTSLRMRAPDDPSGATTNAVAATAANAGGWSETCDRFAHNRSRLTPAHHKRIDALAAAIAARLALVPGGRARIRIDGHTDTSGEEAHNLELGQQRADAARAALELALRQYKLDAARLPPILAESKGESAPVDATGDGVRDAGNRRVEIVVEIEGPAPSASTATQPPPQAEPRPPVVLDLPRDYNPDPPGPRRRDDDWWKRAEENQRKVDEYDRKHPKRTRNINDVLVDGVTQMLEPIIRKLPEGLRGKARDGIRAGIEKGTEAACDAAIDATGVGGDEAKAIKAACHAALKTKPGAQR
jgi:outer membrane protein OmpA-like peptidoglycan-associated protein